MRLHSYVVEHDFGFAPNPFHGVCTLATCKPKIRQVAVVGDYVVGTGCAKRRRQGYLVFFMVVAETITFDEYWRDDRFCVKRPNLYGSWMQAFGDNIYHRSENTGRWVQANSLHSRADGRANLANVQRDTQSSKVLLATDFAYWGGSGPHIPTRFDVCARRGHRNRFPESLVDRFVAWLRSLGERGYVAAPLDWSKVR